MAKLQKLRLGLFGIITSPLLFLIASYGLILFYQKMVTWSIVYQILGFGLIGLSSISMIIYALFLWFIDRGDIYIKQDVLK